MWIYFAVIACACGRPLHSPVENEPVTITEWPGYAQTKGAFLLSRVNLSPITNNCEDLANNLKVATQLIQVIIHSKLVESSNQHIQQFSYLCLGLENSYNKILKYVGELVLCDQKITKEIWTLNDNFQSELNGAWKEIKIQEEVKFRNSPLAIINRGNSLITALEEIRPPRNSQVQNFPGLLAGLAIGTGVIGAGILGSMFGTNNEQEIENLNDKINRIHKNVFVTNERIDMLAKNVTKAITDVKIILEKIITMRSKQDAFQGMLWNLDQLVNNAENIKLSFRLGEITLTMLEAGFINPDLIQVKTFNKIVSEGLKAFPNLQFPLKISKTNMPYILKLTEIKKIGHNTFVMITPLVNKQRFQIYNLIPHPVSVKSRTLVLPEIKNTILVDKDSYIVTDSENIISINNDTHIVDNTEPIWNATKNSCEWEGFKQNASGMVTNCNFKKVGMTTGTFVTENKQHRLLYLTERTTVKLDCPDGKIRDTLQGLNKIPLSCDISTDKVYWPAKQNVKIDIQDWLSEEDPFDVTKLPVININNSNEASDSIRKLISELPSESDAFTFDFHGYNISPEQVQSYSIIAYGALSILVITNSIILGIMLAFRWKKWTSTKERVLKRIASTRESFRSKREDLKEKGHRVKEKVKHPSLSVKSIKSNAKSKMKNKTRLISPKNITRGTNTDSIPQQKIMYPAINRY